MLIETFIGGFNVLFDYHLDLLVFSTTYIIGFRYNIFDVALGCSTWM